MNYFVHDARDLSPAYLASCRKFLKEISNKRQAASVKRATQKPQMIFKTILEFEKDEN